MKIEEQMQVTGAPVFVLSPARSGSTLLRFILDSHPDLACPPETNVALACRYLANTWSVLERAQRGAAPRVASDTIFPQQILTAIRASVESAFEPYLRTTGKTRWCDKSPDSCWDAELLAEIYPEASFICLYRHCMDMIMSAVEARPWGLQERIGLEADSFASQYPGNSVAAGGGYWLAHVRRMLEFEERNPLRCHRVRYEDLVTAPEPTASAIFSFLGARQVAGITASCFQQPHLGDNPGDKKIWFTDRIKTDSLGRGIQVPAELLPGEMRRDINEVLDRLGYRLVDGSWNDTLIQVDPRRDAAPVNAGLSLPDSPESSELLSVIREKIDSRSAAEARWIADHSGLLEGRTLRIIVQVPGGGHQTLSWTIVAGVATEAGLEDHEGGNAITFAADSATWWALLGGSANIDSARKAGRLRLMSTGRRRPQWNEVYGVAIILGLAPVPLTASSASDAVGVGARL